MREEITAFAKYILIDLLETVHRLPVSFAVGVLFLVCYVCSNRLLCRISGGRFPVKRISPFLVFLVGVYLEQLFWLVFFNRPSGSRRGLDLALFETIRSTGRGNSYVMENILLFIPFGILFSMSVAGKRKEGRRETKAEFFTCLFLAFALSLFIEIIQYISARGYSQTDDVVTNVLGAAIGYAAFLPIRRFRIRRKPEEEPQIKL